MAFLYVAARPDITQRELLKVLDATDSVVSRAMAVISHVGAGGVDGLNLITMEEDPKDRRQKLLRLSRAGEKLAAEMLEDLNGGAQK